MLKFALEASKKITGKGKETVEHVDGKPVDQNDEKPVEQIDAQPPAPVYDQSLNELTEKAETNMNDQNSQETIENTFNLLEYIFTHNEPTFKENREIIESEILASFEESESNQIIDELKKKILNFLYSSRYGYPSMNQLRKMTGYSMEDIKSFLSQIPAYTKNKPVINKFERRKAQAGATDEIWACDIMDMQNVKEA